MARGQQFRAESLAMYNLRAAVTEQVAENGVALECDTGTCGPLMRWRLVPGVSRAEFVAATREAAWPLLAARGGDGDGETNSYSLMFEAGPRTYVSWVELNEIPRMPFVEIDGDEPGAELFEQVRRVVAALDDSTLIRLPELSESDDVRSLALFAVGVGGPQDDEPRFASVLEGGLKSDVPVVRRGTLLGLRYLSWPCGLDVLDAIVSEDESAENRELALAAMRRFGREKD